MTKDERAALRVQIDDLGHEYMTNSVPVSRLLDALDQFEAMNEADNFALKKAWAERDAFQHEFKMLQAGNDRLRAERDAWRWVPEILAGDKFQSPQEARSYLAAELKQMRAVVEAATQALPPEAFGVKADGTLVGKLRDALAALDSASKPKDTPG